MKGYATEDLDADRAFFGGQEYSKVLAAAGAHVDTACLADGGLKA
ncbi:hypothetical protein OG422_08345 [Streptomyces sp. NBC_01525]